MLVTLGLVASVVFAIDQVAKHLVEANLTLGREVSVLGDVLILQYVKNPGAAFSLAAGSTWIFSLIAACVVVAVVWFARRIGSMTWGVFFGLLLGGTLGNLYDRLFREPSFGLGHVVDYISTPWLIPAIYNVADIAICSAMAIFVLLTLRGIAIDGTRASDAAASDSAGTGADREGTNGGVAERPDADAAGTGPAGASPASDDREGHR